VYLLTFEDGDFWECIKTTTLISDKGYIES